MIFGNLPEINFSILPFSQKPYLVIFNITQRCNLRCSYCFGRYYSDREELTFRQIKKIFTQFYHLGARRLSLSGGEPLLHQEIDKVIRLAVDLGFEVGINSNGVLVPDHLESLRLLKNLSISLDGATASVHDQFRGKGSFKKVIKGIEAATAAKIPLHFCATLTEANLDKWREILDLGKKYQALVQLSPLCPSFRGEKKTSPNKAFGREIKKVLKEIIKEKERKGNNLFYSKRTYQLVLDWPDFKKDTSSKREIGHPVCLVGKKTVFLDSQGNLFPCLRVPNLVKGQSCLNLGAKRAYNRLVLPPCRSCRWPCFLEYNSLFNFKVPALLNFLTNRRG